MISFEHWLVVLSALISIGGASMYIRDTLRGTTKPNRVSWSMWALAPLIGTAAALAAHADGWSLVRTFLAGFLPLIVFIASFVNRQSYWKLTAFDILCGAFSVVALILWLVIDTPRVAVLFAAIADGLASIPTLRKAWVHPETETGITYITSLVAVLLILPSIPIWNIQNSSFPIYLILTNTALLFTVYRKRIFISQNPISNSSE